MIDLGNDYSLEMNGTLSRLIDERTGECLLDGLLDEDEVRSQIATWDDSDRILPTTEDITRTREESVREITYLMGDDNAAVQLHDLGL
jgi:hypothetical protein